MVRLPPRSARTDTLFPYTKLVRSPDPSLLSPVIAAMPDHGWPGRGNEPPRLGKDGADPRPLVKGKGKEIGLEAPSSIIAGLESWLCRQPELGDRCHIVDVAVPKTGFSADTFLIDLEGCATGVMGKRALVVRI